MYFEVNVTPKAKDEAPAPPETNFSLALAPFQPQTRIRIESPLYTTSQCSLSLKNCNTRTLQVTITKCPPATRAVVLNLSELTIEPNHVKDLTISWTPREHGTWRDIIQLTDSRRVKYDVILTTSTLCSKQRGQKNNSVFPKTTKIRPSGESKRVLNSTENILEFNPAKKRRSITTSSGYNKENVCTSNIREWKTPEKIREKFGNHHESNLSAFLRSESCALTPLPTKWSIQIEQPRSVTPEECKFSLEKRTISLSPQANGNPNIRRETYVCRDRTFDNESNKEEFPDSLSPQKTENPQSDFSMILDEINFTATGIAPAIETEKNTPEISNSTRSPISVNNDTFEMNAGSSLKKSWDINLLTDTDAVSVTDTVLPRNFAHLSPVMPTIDRNRPCHLSTSSPIYTNDTQESYHDVHHSGLNREILCPISKNHSSNLVSKMGPGSLEMICEETQDSTPIANKTWRKRPEDTRCNIRIDISPPKTNADGTLRIRKISPKKFSRISKDKNSIEISGLKRRACLSTSLKNKSRISVPGVRIAKLSLTGIPRNKSPTDPSKPKEVEISVKLRDSNDFFATLCNPDPFAASMTEDPFLASTLYWDDTWVRNQEGEFKKWLNALLTPPEHLTTNTDMICVDVAKIWMSCRLKDDVNLAETKEALSARYHTNTRLNLLRRAACAMVQSNDIVAVLSRATVCVEKGILVIRQDRDLHRDIGLQKIILELFLSYNPLWLRIGLEAIYGETIPLQSNSDIIGLSKFLLARFFSDPQIVKCHSHATVVNLRLPSFMPLMNKFMLKKFLFIVYFLDCAKRNKLIGHDPCLFRKKGTYKESRAILLRFSQEVLSGVGDVTRVLKPYGYILLHKQTELDEYDYAVNNVATDLRDGVRLCRVMELITGRRNLTASCRVPTISRLQKVHNVNIALKALIESGYEVRGNITAKTIADGHREKTLSLLWQIIYKFQAPRFNKAAECLQRWWRSKLWWIRVRNFLRKRRNNAAIVIQSAWRAYFARKQLAVLKTQRKHLQELQERATIVIQSRWRTRSKMIKDRHKFLEIRKSAAIIQRAWRNYRVVRPFVQMRVRKRKAATTIQQYWRSKKVAELQSAEYQRYRKCIITIQRWWKMTNARRAKLREQARLKQAVLFIQMKWRSNRLARIERREYMAKLEAARCIQNWWRRLRLGRMDRDNFLRLKLSVRIVEQRWVARHLSERQEFVKIRRSTVMLQRTWRNYNAIKRERMYFKSCREASFRIQTWWRSTLVRHQYNLMRGSCLLIQRWWRNVQRTRTCRNCYLGYRKSVIKIQRLWRTKLVRRNYLTMKISAVKIQSWWRMVSQRRRVHILRRCVIVVQRKWRAILLGREQRLAFKNHREAAIILQRKWRATLDARSARKSFLAKREAAKTIQKNYRMMRIRREYKKRRNATIVIKTWWKNHKLTNELRASYLVTRNIIILLQKRFRTNRLARQMRSEFLEMKKSCIVVQRRWRAIRTGNMVRQQMKLQIDAATLIQRNYRSIILRRNFQTCRQAVIKIQTKWRATLLAREIENNYQFLRSVTILIQRRFRARRVAKCIRRDFLKLKSTALLVQRKWRAKKLGEKYRHEFLMQKSAVRKITVWRKSIIEGRICVRDFERKRNAILTVQRWYRAKMEERANLESHRARVKASITIQKWWREILHRRAVQKAKETRAAVVIQAIWRGHKVRCSGTKEMMKLRQRSEDAAKSAQSSAALGNRLDIAIDLLQGYDNLGKLTLGLTALDTITRLLPRGCIALCEANLVAKIYNVLHRSNRSRPWIDICLAASSILVSLAKYPPTKHYVWQEQYVETIVRLLMTTYDHEIDLFLRLSTLLWLLAQDPSHATIIAQAPGTVRVLTVISKATSKKKMKHSAESKANLTISGTSLLPDLKPDWGLNRKQPRLFTTVHHAISSLCKRLKIKPITS